MQGYVPGEQPDDPGIVKLNTNENPYPPSPAVEKVVSELDCSDLRLYPPPLAVELRQKIADIHSCSVENVFAGNGSDEILALCTRAFVENDGSIGYLDPSYSLYPVLAEICDVEKRPVALKDDFTWSIPGDYTASLFFLCNPNAPTGMLAPREQVKEFCKGFDGVVLVDEAYVDFSREDCMDIALEMDNVLVSRSLSKSYSLAGLRAGYVVGPEEFIDALFKLKDSYNMDAISQKIALAALSDMAHMEENTSRIKATRARLTAALADAGFEVFPSESNFLWVKPSREKAKDLFERMRNDGILVRYFEGQRTGAYLRITIGTDQDVNKLIDAVNRPV